MKNKFWKVLSLATAFCMLFSFAACGEVVPGDDESDDPGIVTPDGGDTSGDKTPDSGDTSGDKTPDGGDNPGGTTPDSGVHLA